MITPHGSALRYGLQGTQRLFRDRTRSRVTSCHLLGVLIPTAQHHDQRLTALDVVHAPTRPEVFTHLEHAFTYRLYVTQVAKLGLVQPFVEKFMAQPPWIFTTETRRLNE